MTETRKLEAPCILDRYRRSGEIWRNVVNSGYHLGVGTAFIADPEEGVAIEVAGVRYPGQDVGGFEFSCSTLQIRG